MSLKAVLGLILLNDGIIGFSLGAYKIIIDIVTPGRYTYNFPWTPHEIKYICFTAAAVALAVVGIVILAKSRKKEETK